MKKLNFIVLLASAALFLASCNSSDSNGNNTTEGNFIKKSSLDGPNRYYAVAFTIGDSAYVGTGNDGVDADSALNDLWCYNVATNSWTLRAAMPVHGRQQAVAFSAGSKGYVGLGVDNYITYYKDFYAYDPTTNLWTPRADFPGTARARATAFAIGNTGYVTFGRAANSTILKDMYAYNAETDTWSPETSSPSDKRFGATGFVMDGKGYVVGGTDGSALSSDFYSFDPGTHLWTKLRDIISTSDSSYDDSYSQITRIDGVMLVIGSKAYFTTGSSSDGGGAILNTWCYDPATDLWEERSPYERTGRWGAVGFTVQGRGFVGTGSTGTSVPTSNFDEFIPTQDLNTND